MVTVVSYTVFVFTLEPLHRTWLWISGRFNVEARLSSFAKEQGNACPSVKGGGLIVSSFSSLHTGSSFSYTIDLWWAVLPIHVNVLLAGEAWLLLQLGTLWGWPHALTARVVVHVCIPWAAGAPFPLLVDGHDWCLPGGSPCIHGGDNRRSTWPFIWGISLKVSFAYVFEILWWIWEIFNCQLAGSVVTPPSSQASTSPFMGLCSAQASRLPLMANCSIFLTFQSSPKCRSDHDYFSYRHH